MLFYLEYGCSCCKEALVVSADNEATALEFAQLAADECWYSYDQGYDDSEFDDMDEGERAEMEEEDRMNDVFYCVELYDPQNYNHVDTLKEQQNRPHEI